MYGLYLSSVYRTTTNNCLSFLKTSIYNPKLLIPRVVVGSKRSPAMNLRPRLHRSERQEALEPHNGSLLEGINLRGIIARCVKAFHAALYRQYLPRNIRNWFDPPTLPGIKKNGKILFEETKVQFPLFVSTIKKNRKAGKVDRISCFNDKCFYECVGANG